MSATSSTHWCATDKNVFHHQTQLLPTPHTLENGSSDQLHCIITKMDLVPLSRQLNIRQRPDTTDRNPMNTEFAYFASEWLDTKKYLKIFFFGRSREKSARFLRSKLYCDWMAKISLLKTDNLLRCPCTGFKTKVIRTMDMLLCDKIVASEFFFFSIWRKYFGRSQHLTLDRLIFDCVCISDFHIWKENVRDFRLEMKIFFLFETYSRCSCARLSIDMVLFPFNDFFNICK